MAKQKVEESMADAVLRAFDALGFRRFRATLIQAEDGADCVDVDMSFGVSAFVCPDQKTRGNWYTHVRSVTGGGLGSATAETLALSIRNALASAHAELLSRESDTRRSLSVLLQSLDVTTVRADESLGFCGAGGEAPPGLPALRLRDVASACRAALVAHGLPAGRAKLRAPPPTAPSGSVAMSFGVGCKVTVGFLYTPGRECPWFASATVKDFNHGYGSDAHTSADAALRDALRALSRGCASRVRESERAASLATGATR